MRNWIIRRFFTLRYNYDTVIEQQRAQRLLIILGLITFGTILWTFFITVPDLLGETADAIESIIPLIVLASVLMLHQLIQRGSVVVASQIFVALIAVIIVPFAVENVNSAPLVLIILPIILAGVLLGRRGQALVYTIIIALILRGTILSGSTSPINASIVYAILLVISLSTLFLALFNSSLEDITKSAGELILKTQRLGIRTRVVDHTTDAFDIIATAINHLRNDLGYSYIRVVVLDDNHEPEVIYYSSIGVERVARTTNFGFTSTSAFQIALNQRQPQIITQQDPGNISAHLLPASNSGVVIPAYNFNQVVALFDIQSEALEPIAPEVVTVLELYVERIAGDLVYQRMVTTLRNDIQEQQAIIDQQQLQIDKLQINQTEGIVTDWQYYLQQRGMNAIGYDIDDKRQISGVSMGDIPADLQTAFDKGEIIVEQGNDHQQVIIPIHFRDTVLGAISFQIPQEIPITDRKLDFIRSVTERLALALDNKRLLEQTQIQARRETTANEIGSVLLSSTDVESVLQTAVDRFNEALGAVSTRIYLQPRSLQPSDTPQREDAV